MTIRRGEEWGSVVPRPDDLVTVDSDVGLAGVVAADPARPVAVTGGDLHRMLGSPIAGPTLRRLPVDLLRVTVDDRRAVAVAHVVARRSWWSGRIVVATNVDHIGAWNVAPRAHPNDGRFDIMEVEPSMTIRQRWQARARLPLGTHVPHPAIATRTAASATWTFDRPSRVWIDGAAAGTVHRLTVEIEPDAFALHV
jgi:hypothetical protein